MIQQEQEICRPNSKDVKLTEVFFFLISYRKTLQMIGRKSKGGREEEREQKRDGDSNGKRQEGIKLRRSMGVRKGETELIQQS